MLAKLSKYILRGVNFANLKTPNGYIVKSKPRVIMHFSHLIPRKNWNNQLFCVGHLVGYSQLGLQSIQGPVQYILPDRSGRKEKANEKIRLHWGSNPESLVP